MRSNRRIDMNNYKKFFICLTVIFLMSFSLFSYKTRYNIRYKVDSYTITSLEDDFLVWTKYDFSLNEDDSLDIIKNSSKYYLVVFNGEMFNNHFYSLYNWLAVEKEPLSYTIDYWIESTQIEGTYAFEAFTEHSHNVAVLVKCEENEIKDFCENMLLNQLLFCQGEIIVEGRPIRGRFYD